MLQSSLLSLGKFLFVSHCLSFMSLLCDLYIKDVHVRIRLVNTVNLCVSIRLYAVGAIRGTLGHTQKGVCCRRCIFSPYSLLETMRYSFRILQPSHSPHKTCILPKLRHFSHTKLLFSVYSKTPHNRHRFSGPRFSHQNLFCV